MDQSSPFLNLLNTNTVPTDQDVANVKSFIRTEQGLLDDVNNQIQVLAERRAGHGRVVEEYSILLSPIRRIPPDILLSIFECTCWKVSPLPDSLNGVERTAKLRYPSQVILSQVCQQWRHLSLGHPILWSEICFIVPALPWLIADSLPAALEEHKIDLAEHNDRIERMIAKNLAYIVRSDQFPLTVTLNTGDSGDRNATIVDMLCGVSKRWKQLTLSLSLFMEDSPLLRIFRLTSNDLPLLERLELADIRWGQHLTYDQEPPPAAISSTELTKAHRLQTLKIIKFPKLIQYQTDVNWKTVTDLHVDHYLRACSGTQHAINLLSSFPQLVVCSIELNMIPPDDSQTDVPGPSLPLRTQISLPHLKSLTLRGCLPRGLASSLDLPSLQVLCLPQSYELGDIANGEVVDWARNFGSQLKELTFHYVFLTQSALIYTLENLPNLSVLRMVGNRPESSGYYVQQESAPVGDSLAVLSDSILEKLMPGRGGTGGHPFPLCPKLRRISLLPGSIEFTERALVKLIAARRGRHLRSPDVDCDAAQTLGMVSMLESAFILFPGSKKRNPWKMLQEDDTIDLEGFHLVAQTRQQMLDLLPHSALDDLTVEEFNILDTLKSR